MREFAAGRLDEDEIADLLHEYRQTQDPKCKESLVRQYRNLVESVARRYAAYGEQMDDLVQEGYMGLLKAADKFERDKGVKFATFATHFIRGHIKHYLRDKAKIIRPPAWLQELSLRIDKARDTLRHDLSREPTTREVAAELGMDEASIASHYAVQDRFRVASLDGGEEDAGILEKIAAPPPGGHELPFEDREVLRCALAQLKDVERQVMERFFFASLSQTEIADALGISVNYVSHLLRSGTEKLRKIMTTQELIESQIRIRELQKRVATYEQAVEEYTVVDLQTQLYNRRYFSERLDEEISRASRYEEKLSILLLDLRPSDGRGLTEDGRFNDDVVRSIAGTIRDNIRRVDIPARLDNSRFALILPHTGETVAVVEERLTQKLREQRGPVKCRVNVRSGYAVYPAHGRSQEDLMSRAIACLEGSAEADMAA
jgi:RNA polymerase sigma factor (sigma-70 family)